MENRRAQDIQTEVEVARGVASSFSFYILGINQQNFAIGQSISTDPSFTQQDIIQLLKNSALYYPAIQNISWVDSHGIVLFSSQAGLEQQDFSDRPFFQKILMGKPWFVGDLIPSGIVTQSPLFTVATAIRDRHENLIGAVIAAIDPDRLGELVLTGGRPERGEYTIFDSQGTMVYDSAGRALQWEDRLQYKQKNENALLDSLTSGMETSGITPLGPSGEEWVVAQVPVPGIPYHAGARRPESVVLGSLQRDLAEGLLAVLMVAGIALLAAYLMDRTIVNPIRNLDRQATSGEPILLGPNSHAPIEVRHLFDSIQAMKTNLVDRAKALQESEERYRILFHNRHTPMLVIDPTTARIVDANQAAADFYGWEQTVLTRMRITEINILPKEQAIQKMNMAQNSRTHQTFFFQHRLANGDIREVEVHSGPIHRQGKTYVFSIINDITDRKKVEQALQLKNQMIELSYEPIYTWNLDETITSWNQGCEQVYGYTRAEAIGKIHHELLKTVQALPREDFLRQLRLQGEWTGQLQQITKSGEILVVESRQQLMEIADGWHVLETNRDITQRIQFEKALETALEKAKWLARFPEENPNPVLRISKDRRVLYINPAAKKLPWWKDCEIGYCLPDPLAHLVEKSFVEEKEVSADANLEGKSYTVSILPVMEEEYVNLYGTDITDRKLAEEALQNSEERFNKAFNAEPSPLLISRIEDGAILEVNQTFERVFGYTRAEAVGKTTNELRLFISSKDHGRLMQYFQKHSFVDNYELAVRTKGGEIRQASVSTELIQTRSGTQMLTVIQDITERKQAEESLRASEARLRRLFDTSVIGILNLDETGRVYAANAALRSLLGYSKEEVEAGSLTMDQLLPDEYRLLEQQTLVEVAMEGTSRPHEQEFIRKDGSQVPVLVGHTLLEGQPQEFIEFVIDLSDLKAAQAAQQEVAEKLKTSNRDLEQFAFVASHDLQEPLRKIKFFGDSIHQKLQASLDEENADYLDRMVKAAERMQNMINALLELSRVNMRAEPFQEIDLNEVIQEVLEDLEDRLQKENGQVLIETLGKVEADPHQMQRLFQNLIGNALKYHFSGVAPVVKVTGQTLPGKKRKLASVVVKIEDNGIGFDEQYTERIFQPFQRLHGRGEYEGTGMGLAICKKIVDRHHGRITAHSIPGKGSTFMVELPVHQAP